jgi:hypothetical protein
MTSILEHNALAEKSYDNAHGTFTVYIGRVVAHRDGAEVHVTWSVRHNTHAAEQTFVLEAHDPFLEACDYSPEADFSPELVANRLTEQVEVDFDKHANETLISLGFGGNMLHPRAFCWDQADKRFDQHPI